MAKTKIEKLSFKTIKPTGKYRSFEPNENQIKLGGEVIGTIGDEAPFKIYLMVIKKDINEDGNPNSPWKIITLKRQNTSIEDAKQFMINNIEELKKLYTFFKIKE